MKTVLAIGMLLLGVASANACDVYTSELFDPGLRVAAYNAAGELTITNTGEAKIYNGESRTYGPDQSVGTGIPYRYAVNEKDESDSIRVRGYKDALIIDMEVFEPYCK